MLVWCGYGLFVLVVVIIAIFADGYGHPGKHH